MSLAPTSAYTTSYNVIGPTDVSPQIASRANRTARFVALYRRHFVASDALSSFRPEGALQGWIAYAPDRVVTTEEGEILKQALLQSVEIVHKSHLIE
jgi:hypothetical protein